MSFIAINIGIFLLSLTGVEVYRRWSLRREILDIPNERSSHSIPTPRGGGAVIVAIAGGACAAMSWSTFGAGQWRYFAGGAIVAAISLADDIRPLSPFFRLIFHSVAAALAVSAAIPFSNSAEALIAAAAFAWIVWLVNAYNFMDGIDGIAAVQAVVAGLGWASTGSLFGLPDIAFYGGAIAASSAGFLVLNWQPAKIFMGDVGSAFLGYAFAVLPLACLGRVKASPSAVLAFGLLVVWFFVFDTVVTFMRRAARGDRVWQAHREHLYQKLVIAGSAHARISLLYGALGFFLAVSAFFALVFGGGADMVALLVLVFETTALIVLARRAAREANS